MQKKKVKKSKAVSAKKATAKKAVKKVVPVVAPPAAPVVFTSVVKTDADKIWEEIMNLKIEMFALPSQLVWQHCTPVKVEPSRLYLTIRSSATLPSLEFAIGSGYTVSLVDKFVIVERVKQSLFAGK